MARLPITTRVAVDRLDADETERMATELLGAPPSRRPCCSPCWLDRPATRCSSSNWSATAPGDDLPSTLHELLRARIGDLPDTRAGCSGGRGHPGRPADVALLAPDRRGDPGRDRGGTARGHRPARARGARGRCRRVRAPGVRRGRLRRAAADRAAHLAPPRGRGTRAGRRPRRDLGTSDVAAELARHWLSADDVGRALDASVAAGLAAREMFAFEDAQASFARAAELTDRVDSHHDRAWLLGEAAQAAHLAGDSDEAIRLATAALEVTEEPAARAALCERLGAFHYLAGHGEDAEAWLHRALDRLPDDADDQLSARVHAGLAMFTAAWSRWTRPSAGARRRARRGPSVRCPPRGGPAPQRARQRARPAGRRTTPRSPTCATALTIAAEVGGPDDLALAYVNLTHVLGLAGRLDEVADTGRTASAELARIGLTRQIGSVLTANACEALLDTGRLDEAPRSSPRPWPGDPGASWPRRCTCRPVGSRPWPATWMSPGSTVSRPAWSWRPRTPPTPGGAPAPSAPPRSSSGRDGPRPPTVLVTRRAGADRRAPTRSCSPGGWWRWAARAVADFAESHRDRESRRQVADMQRSARRGRRSRHRGDDGVRRRAGRVAAGRVVPALQCRRPAAVGPPRRTCGTPPVAGPTRPTPAGARPRPGCAPAATRSRSPPCATRTGGRPCLRPGDCSRRSGPSPAGTGSTCRTRSPTRPTRRPLAAYALTTREVEVLGCLVAGLTNGEIADRLFISCQDRERARQQHPPQAGRLGTTGSRPGRPPAGRRRGRT